MLFTSHAFSPIYALLLYLATGNVSLTLLINNYVGYYYYYCTHGIIYTHINIVFTPVLFYNWQLLRSYSIAVTPISL